MLLLILNALCVIGVSPAVLISNITSTSSAISTPSVTLPSDLTTEIIPLNAPILAPVEPGESLPGYFPSSTQEPSPTLLDLDQSFIPTLQPLGDPEEEDTSDTNDNTGTSIKDTGNIGGSIIDLKYSGIISTGSVISGISTIDSESPWENSVNSANKELAMEAPYGSWKSPITSEMVVQNVNEIVEPPKLDPVTGNIFWCEQLSAENGKNVVFHYNPETKSIVRWTSEGFDVRTKVHEYGGGAFTVYNDTLFFSNGDDGAVYRQDGPDGVPKALTNTSYRRYADPSYSPQLDSLFMIVEDHDLMLREEATEPENGVIMIDAQTGDQKVIAAHADFFSSPRISQDGNFLVWVQWNHPNMPWGETRMFVGEIKNKRGKLAITKYFQHGSMMMPSFNQNNELLYVHDSTGWWNLYKVNRKNFEINLTNQSQEVGWPMWHFGRQAYDSNPQIGSNEVVAICGNDLTIIDSMKLEKKILHTGYSSYSLGVIYSKDGSKVYVVAGDGMRYPRLIEVEVATGVTKEIRHEKNTSDGDHSSGSLNSTAFTSYDIVTDPGYISIARQIQFPTTQGDFAYGYLYLPKNKDYKAPAGTKPPLLVKAHEGPTNAASKVLNLLYQFFTSRGFAILDVDYRGSTGYGTLYRTKLNEMWGVYDVDDVLAGSEYLVKEGIVDKNMICIDGHSAGGYTTLSALTVTGSIFKAGASYYGISDLEMLAQDTHKFESKYMEGLIGNIKEHKERYVIRSPLRNSEKLDVPMLFFQGTDDKIVPPSQARKMYELVKGKGLPTALMLFEGEGHGFIETENRQKSLEAEIYFFAQIFNITLGDVTSDLVIDNLNKWRNEDKVKKIVLS